MPGSNCAGSAVFLYQVGRLRSRVIFGMMSAGFGRIIVSARNIIRMFFIIYSRSVVILRRAPDIILAVAQVRYHMINRRIDNNVPGVCRHPANIMAVP